jgi:hypothetical protein
MKAKIIHAVGLSYTIAAITFSVLFVEPALQPRSIFDFRLWADSQLYMEFAENYLRSNEDLLSIPINVVGPVLIGIFLKNNNFHIVLLNIAFFWTAYYFLSKSTKINSVIFLTWLMINPMFFFSLVNLNKEIFALASMMFITSIKEKKSSNLILHILSFVTSFLARFSHTLVYLIYYLFLAISNRSKSLFVFLPRSHTQLFLISIVFMSIYLPASVLLLSDVYDFSETSEFVISQANTSGGAVLILKALDDNFLFFIGFIPKIVLNYVGNIGRVFDIIFNVDKTLENDIYNKYVVLGHQVCMLLILFRFVIRKVSINLNKDKTILLIAIYTLIHCGGYLINYRIFFPTYGLLAFLLSTHNYNYDASKN